MILRIAGREVGTWAFLTRFNRKEEFKPNVNLKALHIRFIPDQEAETNISSREFIKKAEFVDAEAFAGMLKEDDNPASSNTGGGDMPGNGD